MSTLLHVYQVLYCSLEHPFLRFRTNFIIFLCLELYCMKYYLSVSFAMFDLIFFFSASFCVVQLLYHRSAFGLY